MSEPIPTRSLQRLISVPAPKKWTEVVFVCSKCMKRQQRKALRSDLKHALKKAGRRDIRVIASGCFDLCPKRGVTIARGADLGAPARLHVLDNRDDVEVVERWLLESTPVLESAT
ncbi:MAG: hypothetical protein ACREPX_11870 [Rhodanobacteraceae bacterium]